jgi:hypothetical protein
MSDENRAMLAIIVSAISVGISLAVLAFDIFG